MGKAAPPARTWRTLRRRAPRVRPTTPCHDTVRGFSGAMPTDAAIACLPLRPRSFGHKKKVPGPRRLASGPRPPARGSRPRPSAPSPRPPALGPRETKVFPLGPILIFLLIFSSSSSPSSTTSFSGGNLAQPWLSFGPTKPCLSQLLPLRLAPASHHPCLRRRGQPPQRHRFRSRRRPSRDARSRRCETSWTT